MWVSAFSEEADEEEDDSNSADGNGTTSPEEAEYNFDGFNIDFSEKVALMPAGATGATTSGGVQRNG